MIQLFTPTNEEVIKEILHLDPLLSCRWLEIHNNNDLIGKIQLQPITKITFNIHLDIHKEHQKKGLANKIEQPLIEYCIKAGIHSLICTIAEENKNMLKVMMKTKFKCAGLIKNGIIYNNKKQNLILFQLEVI